MLPIVHYDEVQSACADRSATLLLGNGFSQAYQRRIFSYKALYEKAEFGQDHDAIKRVFAKLRTSDFESVMRALERAASVNSCFIDSNSKRLLARLNRKLNGGSQRIRHALVAAIRNLHPDSAHVVPDDGFGNVPDFLRQFQRIFTLNYDLLLYWSLMRHSCTLTFADGFRPHGAKSYLLWKKDNAESSPRQSVFFLHGALHLIQTDDGLRKLRSQAYNPILDQVSRYVLNGTLPLLVAEGSGSQKIRSISKSPYLVYCMEQLKKTSSVMVVFGVNFNNSDRHILAAIEQSQSSRVFVSFFGNKSSAQVIRLSAKLQEMQDRWRATENGIAREIVLFDSGEVQLWKHNTEA